MSQSPTFTNLTTDWKNCHAIANLILFCLP